MRQGGMQAMAVHDRAGGRREASWGRGNTWPEEAERPRKASRCLFLLALEGSSAPC